MNLFLSILANGNPGNFFPKRKDGFFGHHGEGGFNKIIGKIMEQDVAKGWE